MKIALVGMGKMGTAIETLLADNENHEVVTRFNQSFPFTKDTSIEALSGATIAIDFSHPEIVVQNIEQYCQLQLNCIIGTTGWDQHLPYVKSIVEESSIGLLYAPNFSVGIFLLQKALEAMLPILNELPTFDAFIHEWHHINKLDSPSGTALRLGEIVLNYLDRKTIIEPQTSTGKIDPTALHITSTRVGSVFGEHIVGFDNPHEALYLRHVAKDRTVFASGALFAMEWLGNKKGFFRFEDIFI